MASKVFESFYILIITSNWTIDRKSQELMYRFESPMPFQGERNRKIFLFVSVFNVTTEILIGDK